MGLRPIKGDEESNPDRSRDGYGAVALSGDHRPSRLQLRLEFFNGVARPVRRGSLPTPSARIGVFSTEFSMAPFGAATGMKMHDRF
ncbi:MAG: hypothetical protein JWP63_3400 [Candidatus Solibacter sp.]|jgi:hypothetical protein|nr:hypothetical protein [Candidatus Solibacter sp.]